MHKIRLILIVFLLLVGCNQITSSSKYEKLQPTLNPIVESDAKETQFPTSSASVNSNPVIIGTFLCSGYSPFQTGVAKVSRMGMNKYHLIASMTYGYSHNNGEIETDFSYDGNKFIILNQKYSIVKISFTENSITIDYPGEHFGGNNAEPKGTFYLEHTDSADSRFLTKVYDTLKLPDPYRHGLSEVLTYELDDKLLLLVRTRNDKNVTQMNADFLLMYKAADQSLSVIGEISDYKEQDLQKELNNLGADSFLIYQILHKDYADRLVKLKMHKWDNGDLAVGESGEFQLTETEAIYIVTGVEKATSVTTNMRSADNIGSIFKTEVDRSDNKTVTIHSYEIVRKDQNDEHTVTQDWLEVNRLTGNVSSLIW
ncbi:hypothetical protein BC351_04805 [Paenibacillus ferrarius]|uniref:Uncharacterized protein n=1 Tax=Paenibacillus ferrarius TaxID=1469647 RepID=A0A1V4HLE0_9BACL|nr:hypothetical protein [Paenibacillus ferrarius]OPH57819.1 hypothetical protein BC351_04805 [Paenibacillus ferrarius]